jgi:hypothetical protein
MRAFTIFLTAAAIAVAASASATAAGPTASAATNCRLSAAEQGGQRASTLGASYVRKLSVSGISCSSGRTLAKAYHACRRRNGGARGRCSYVSGYHCTERRYSSRFQFDASATCKRGARAFSQTYTVNF